MMIHELIPLLFLDRVDDAVEFALLKSIILGEQMEYSPSNGCTIGLSASNILFPVPSPINLTNPGLK